jgi:hypothetical protein
MFYPIGNTSAVCLTQDLASEQDADIFLLGCGDPRNVLYTLHSGRKAAGSAYPSRDFACFAFSLITEYLQASPERSTSPALTGNPLFWVSHLLSQTCMLLNTLTARNIMLFALLANDKRIDTVWNIFYHFSIDDHSLETLVKQYRILIQASSSMES